MTVERVTHHRILAATAQLIQQGIGFHAVADAHFMLCHQIFQAGYRRIG